VLTNAVNSRFVGCSELIQKLRSGKLMPSQPAVQLNTLTGHFRSAGQVLGTGITTNYHDLLTNTWSSITRPFAGLNR
jgi:hypothetical protein